MIPIGYNIQKAKGVKMLNKKRLTRVVLPGLCATLANSVIADEWTFNEFDNLNSGYSESRLSVTSKDLTTALELVCNQYGVQLLVTATGWQPAFYDQGVSWLADSNQGGRLDIPPTDSTAGLRGAWQALTEEQPKKLLNAINSSDILTLRFKINGNFQNKVLDTTGAANSAALFLDSCLL